MSKVVANMVVSFGGDVETDAKALIELDGVANDGKTRFNPGDIVNFLINYDTTKLSLVWVKSTSGDILISGEKTEDRINESALWIYSADTNVLGYIPAGTLAPVWFGNEGTGMRLVETYTAGVAGGIFPAICHITYPVSFVMGKLFTPTVTLADEDSYPITIVAHFEAK